MVHLGNTGSIWNAPAVRFSAFRQVETKSAPRSTISRLTTTGGLIDMASSVVRLCCSTFAFLWMQT